MSTTDNSMSAAEAALVLGCSKRKAQELLGSGDLEGWRIGKLWRTDAGCIERFKRKHSNQRGASVVALGGGR